LFDFPISVFQACSLAAYQTDPKHSKVNLLRKHGFGIITVDEDGLVAIQHACIPLAQHISAEQLDGEIAKLNPSIKVALKGAYQTYETNEGQGLQQAGQIVESVINSIARQAANRGDISTAVLASPLADIIDELYQSKTFKPHRAALGDARSFTKDFRNTASHPPKDARDAAKKIRKCKAGFLNAIGVCHKLKTVAAATGYRIRLLVP
jgi:hypothetical protein